MPPRSFPALEIEWPAPPGEEAVALVLADLDDWSPTGVEEQARGIRVFFRDDEARRRAAATLQPHASALTVRVVDVPDEDWAARSQADLGPVAVEHIVVTPPWTAGAVEADYPGCTPVTIVPSMGFGTGHHPSTRLCLALLQTTDPVRSAVVDVGTGSGVLAIAAALLGASRVVAVEDDPDAADTARENVSLNAGAAAVQVEVADITRTRPADWGAFDLLLANLTGAMLERLAAVLVGGVRPGGTLIVSGVETWEASGVVSAFAGMGAALVDERTEQGWTALKLRAPSGPAPPGPQ